MYDEDISNSRRFAFDAENDADERTPLHGLRKNFAPRKSKTLFQLSQETPRRVRAKEDRTLHRILRTF